jgi:hypothetical protein
VRHEGTVRADGGEAAKKSRFEIGILRSLFVPVRLLRLPLAALRLAALRCNAILIRAIRQIRDRKSRSRPVAKCQYPINLLCLMMPRDSGFGRALLHFVSNQRKCLYINDLQLIDGFSDQAQSSLIKPNQAKSSQIKVGSVIILAVLMTQNGK